MVASAATKLPPNLQEKVLAVVLYGAGEGTNLPKSMQQKALANCAPGDFVSLLSSLEVLQN